MTSTSLSKIKKIWASFLEALSSPAVQDKLLNILRTTLVENLIVSVLKLSGFKAWILGLIADRVIDEGDERLVEPLFREIGFESDRLDGADVYRRVSNAQNTDDWLDAVSDV